LIQRKFVIYFQLSSPYSDGSHPYRGTRFVTSTSSSHLIRNLHVSSRIRSELSHLICRTYLEHHAISKRVDYLTNAVADGICI